MTTWTVVGATLPDGSRTDLHIADGLLVESAPAGAQRVDADGLVALAVARAAETDPAALAEYDAADTA